MNDIVHENAKDQTICQIVLADQHIIRAAALLSLVAVLLIPWLLSLCLTPGVGL